MSSIPQLSSEIWQEVFLRLPTFRDLLRASAVNHHFHGLVMNKWFFERYVQKQQKLSKDLLINIDFSNDDSDNKNLFHNSLAETATGVKGLNDREPCRGNFKIEMNDPQFKFAILKMSGFCSTYNSFKLNSDHAGAVSISLWISYEQLQNWTQRTFYVKFENVQREFLGYFLFHMNAKNQLVCVVQFNKNSTFGNDRHPVLEAKTVYHLAFVYSPSTSTQSATLEIYIDGKQFIYKDVLDLKFPFRSVEIQTEGYDLSLADLAVWKRELKPWEVRLIHEQKKSVKETDVVQFLLEKSSKKS